MITAPLRPFDLLELRDTITDALLDDHKLGLLLPATRARLERVLRMVDEACGPIDVRGSGSLSVKVGG